MKPLLHLEWCSPLDRYLIDLHLCLLLQNTVRIGIGFGYLMNLSRVSLSLAEWVYFRVFVYFHLDRYLPFLKDNFQFLHREFIITFGSIIYLVNIRIVRTSYIRTYLMQSVCWSKYLMWALTPTQIHTVNGYLV
jgi:hypothetical protein